MHRANRVQIEQPPQLAMPGLETEIVVHHQPDARVFRCIHEPPPRPRTSGLMPSAKDMDAVLARQTTDLAVRRRGRDDVDEVRSLGFQHRRDVCVDATDSKSARRLLGPFARCVAQRHECRARTRPHAS